jgi:SAM-dependent methyltransferase
MLSWAAALASRRPRARILDFGCGDGKVVEAARNLGLELYGADVFYQGPEEREKILKSGLLGTLVREIRDGRIPFEDETFDLILSNQVFEHVEDLDPTIAELSRVLKRSGLLVCLFPTREVVREAHCGVPFLHWLPKGARGRRAYAELRSFAGFSFDKEKKARRQWASDAVEWVDRYVFYRRRAELLRSLERAFRWEPIEDHYLSYRLAHEGGRGALGPLLRIPWVREAARAFCRRFNGTAILARKPPE